MAEQGLDMVGSNVTEFVEAWDRPVATTDLPITHDEIVAYSKRRNPFRHPPMTFRRSKVLAAGSYNADFPYFEDWDLFNRMLASGCRAANVRETLVAMRVSPDFYGSQRRPRLSVAREALQAGAAGMRYFSAATTSSRLFPRQLSASCPTPFAGSCTQGFSGKGEMRSDYDCSNHHSP